MIHNFIFHPNAVKNCHLKILFENSKQIHTMKDIPGDTASLVRPSKEKSKDFWQTQHTVKATIMLFLPHVPLTYCPQPLLEEGGKPTESEPLFNSATVALTIRSPLEPPALPTGINHCRASVEALTKSSLKDKPCEVLWTLPVVSCYTSDIYWEFTAEGSQGLTLLGAQHRTQKCWLF